MSQMNFRDPSRRPAARPFLRAAICSWACLLLTAAPALGAVLHVDDDAPPGGDGRSWDAAFVHLADALEAAADDPAIDEIRVAGGRYRPDRSSAVPGGTGDRGSSFALVGGVAHLGGFRGLAGGGSPDDRDPAAFPTVLDGDLLGDDEPDFGRRADNARHVVRVGGAGPGTALEGMTVRGGHADGGGIEGFGGGIRIDPLSVPAIANCLIEDCHAVQGGGLHARGVDGLLLSGCTVRACAADVAGGGVQLTSVGATLVGCLVEDCSATSLGGGGLSAQTAALEVLGGAVRGCESGLDGGGVLLVGASGSIDGLELDANTAAALGGGGLVLANADEPLVLSNLLVRSNLAFDHGGGLAIDAVRGSVLLAGGTIEDNLAVNDGGGVRVTGDGPLEITDLLVTLNLAGDDGGGLHLAGGTEDRLVRDCAITANEASDRGGGVFVVGGEAVHERLTITGNVAGLRGGGLAVDGGASILRDLGLIANEAADVGGGLHVEGGTPVIDGVLAEANAASSSGGGGYLEDSAAEVLGGTFLANTTGAFSTGGGLTVSGGAPRLDGARFEANASNSGGGLTLEAETTALVETCTFLGNQALLGGGVFVQDCQPRLIGCTLTGNRATGSFLSGGGGVYLRTSDAEIRACTFTDNETSLNGGAIYNEDAAPLIAGCSMLENLAGETGGAIGSANGAPTVISGTMIGNRAGLAGGAIRITLGAALIANCLIGGNEATGVTGEGGCEIAGTGGGISGLNAQPVITNCTIVANRATCGGNDTGDGNGAGGGLHLLFGEIRNCVLWLNEDASGTTEAAQVTALAGVLDVDHSCIQGLTGTIGGPENIGDDPLFVDPAGPDGVAGTEDDDLRLGPASPCIDLGDTGALPADVADLDGDGALDEPLPLDLDGGDRVVDGLGDGAPAVDLGAFERAEPIPCPADLDRDGVVETGDLLELLAGWGPCPDCPADLDGDGVVATPDLLALLSAWGPCRG